MRADTTNAARPARDRNRAAALLVAALSLLSAAPTCRAGIDHLVPYDDSGIWARRNQEIVEYGLIAVTAGGALWEGGETRLGKTFWRSVDSGV
ncbi:MAG TPA: hypothetical protein VE266_02250, partial [Steroidobacteraceae bacterium]|nr:hypothetical protein [Steroidobacteraceae bacterium]